MGKFVIFARPPRTETGIDKAAKTRYTGEKSKNEVEKWYNAMNAAPCTRKQCAAAQTAADNDGLTAALPRRVLFCEMPGRMRRRTGLFCALAHRAKKKFLFIVLRWVGRNFVKCVEYYRKICERRPMNIP